MSPTNSRGLTTGSFCPARPIAPQELAQGLAPAHTPSECGRLSRLRGGVLGHVASLLPVRDLVSLSLANAAVCMDVGPQLRLLGRESLEVTERVADVQDLAGFLSVLGGEDAAGAVQAPTIAGLRSDLQFRPMASLLGRIPQLPAHDRQPAVAAFRARVAALNTDYRTAALMTFERIAGHRQAGVAARAGENVQLVNALFGVTDPADIAIVEHDAVRGAAGSAVHRGENVRVVAQRHGIETPVGIQWLERNAAIGTARDAVRSGENVRVVAQRHGLESPVAIAALEQNAPYGPAGDAVLRGESVQVIAAHYGIQTAAGILSLELSTIHGPAGFAVQQGENVCTVAQRHGIETAVGIGMLEQIAVEFSAGEELRQGGNVRVVAARHGITRPDTISQMEVMAIVSLPVFGAWATMDPQTVAQDLGIETPAHIERLRALAERLASGQRR